MILLFGSTGYIGSEFKRQLNKLNLPFLCWSNTRTTTFESLQSWHQNENSPKVTFVINSAGYTGKPNVDACEVNKDKTIHGNVVWPQIITNFCMTNNIPLGHVSSGCIYSGRRYDGHPFTELDDPNFTFIQNNCSFYSGTKAISEHIVNELEKSYIWRLRIPFEENNNPRNYISKMMNYEELLQSENSISNKQEFVNACIEMITKRVPYGIYNITNTGYITTNSLVEKLKNTISKNKTFTLINESEFYKRWSNTPRSNCVMDNSKLLSTGIKMRTADESIDYCLKNWVHFP